MELKKLVQKEHQGMKARMEKETEGIYVLWYMLTGFTVLLMCIYGFIPKEDGVFLSIMGGWMSFACLSWWGMFLKSVKVDNRRVNIFKIYNYIPVDSKLLIKAKMIVFAKYTAVPLIIGQVLALLIRFWNPDNIKGQSLGSVFGPLYIAVVLYAYEYISMKLSVKFAMK